MKLISACLLGIRCAWNGNDNTNERALELSKIETLIPVCPEQLGGLSTPRAPQEIQGGAGEDVLNGECKVMNREGKDVTRQFIRGAKETLKIAKQLEVKEFIARSRSPSCGCAQIYDGSFSGGLRDGDGVTAALLRRNGIRIIPEGDLQFVLAGLAP
ncbi:MAG: DUF523 domain-containing protein [Chloroflexota bacterium]|nr:DUF523 domain-containing protein [Chloroflexota bacterium]